MAAAAAAAAPAPTAPASWRRRELLSVFALALGGARAAEEAAAEEDIGTIATRALRMKWDKNKDGKVDHEEYMHAAMNELDMFGTEKVDADFAKKFYERLFSLADMNGDGSLSDEELEYEEFLHSYTSHIKHKYNKDGEDQEDEFGYEHMAKLVAEADKNGNGVIDKDEWTKEMGETAAKHWGWDGYLDEPDVKEWFGKLYERADVNKDGTLDAKEVQYGAFLGQEWMANGAFPELRLANDLMREMDENKDGKIDAEEVAKVVERAALGKDEGKGDTVAEMVQKGFEGADANGDKHLDRAEVRKLSSSIAPEL